jgi:hypothetical protein
VPQVSSWTRTATPFLSDVGSKHLDFDADPWEWCDTHDPACVLRCESTRQVVARTWRTPSDSPEGVILYRTDLVGQRPHDLLQEGTILRCPVHEWVMVPTRYIEDWSRSKFSHAPVYCADPTPLYRGPS